MTAVDNLALLAGAPGGIPSIRQLVRDLAVGGRLLPDLNPDVWPVVQLADLVESFQNGVSSRGASDGVSVVVLRLADIKNGSVSLDEPRRLTLDESSIEKYRLAIGDVLVIRVNGSADLVGRFVVCESSVGLHCDHFIRLRLDMTRIDARYLKLVGDCSSTRTRIQELFVSTAGQKTVNQTHIGSLPFALPPLAEQHRIVDKVDELMALCDRLEARQQDAEAAHARLVQALLDSLTQARDADEFQACWRRLAGQFESLFTTLASVEQLKALVLQMAVSGRLVPQKVSDGSAMDMLLATADLRKKSCAGRVTQTSFRANTAPAALPGGWVATTVGEVLICRDGERVPVSQTDRDGRAKLYDYYGASGVIDKIDGFLFDKPLLLVGEDGANLVNRSTPIAFIARGKYWVNNHAHVLDGVDEELLGYMALFFNAIDLKPYVTGTAQPKLNQARLNAIPVPLPPPGEQRRIVAKVTELLDLCDQLKARLAAASAKHTQLAEALVAHAVAA